MALVFFSMILALVGQKGVGKDTVANYLVDKHGFTKLAFADPIKNACEILFGVERVCFEDTNLKEVSVEHWNKSPRQMMQYFGADIVRTHMGEDFWVKHMQRRLHALEGRNTVVTDVRFVNEAAFLRNLGAVLVRVERVGVESSDQHVTEVQQYVINTDKLVTNTVFDELYKQLDALVVNQNT